MGIDETGSSNIGAIRAVRQGQQNRRGRGRSNNNRKNHNPLARSFESNGPDVKIRGTPAHIAEKYLTLSRDAQTSGDPVLAENYLQHAEHYMRIIMAYRDQLQQPGDMPHGNGTRLREPGDMGDEFGDDEGEDMLDEGFAPPHPNPPQHQSPPQHQAPRHSGGYEANPNRQERPFRRDQQRGFRDRSERDRSDRGDRDRVDRDRPVEGRPAPQERPPPQERPHDPAEASGEPRRRDRFQQPHEQPDFLRRPVRRSRTETEPAAPPPTKEEPPRD